MNNIKRIKSLAFADNFELILEFYSGEVRILDLKPIMEEYPLFHALEENGLFKRAKIDIGGFGIVWDEEFSISAGDAYERSTSIESDKSILKDILIKSIAALRKDSQITQTELSKIANIPQPTIAKIESTRIDPHLSTVLSIVDSLGYRLELVPKEHIRRS